MKTQREVNRMDGGCDGFGFRNKMENSLLPLLLSLFCCRFNLTLTAFVLCLDFHEAFSPLFLPHNFYVFHEKYIRRVDPTTAPAFKASA